MGRPSYKLRVPDDVSSLIRNLHPHIKKKIKASLQMILRDPDSGKALKSELSGLRSFRTGRFRIIYGISEKTIDLIAVGPRETIYAETMRLLRK